MKRLLRNESENDWMLAFNSNYQRVLQIEQVKKAELENNPERAMDSNVTGFADILQPLKSINQIT